MPVQQLVKVEFIVNLKAAKTLALAIPLPAARPRRRGDRIKRRQLRSLRYLLSLQTRTNHDPEPFARQGVPFCWIGAGTISGWLVRE